MSTGSPQRLRSPFHLPQLPLQSSDAATATNSLSETENSLQAALESLDAASAAGAAAQSQKSQRQVDYVLDGNRDSLRHSYASSSSSSSNGTVRSLRHKSVRARTQLYDGTDGAHEERHKPPPHFRPGTLVARAQQECLFESVSGWRPLVGGPTLGEMRDRATEARTQSLPDHTNGEAIAVSSASQNSQQTQEQESNSPRQRATAFPAAQVWQGIPLSFFDDDETGPIQPGSSPDAPRVQADDVPAEQCDSIQSTCKVVSEPAEHQQIVVDRSQEQEPHGLPSNEAAVLQGTAGPIGPNASPELSSTKGRLESSARTQPLSWSARRDRRIARRRPVPPVTRQRAAQLRETRGDSQISSSSLQGGPFEDVVPLLAPKKICTAPQQRTTSAEAQTTAAAAGLGEHSSGTNSEQRRSRGSGSEANRTGDVTDPSFGEEETSTQVAERHVKRQSHGQRSRLPGARRRRAPKESVLLRRLDMMLTDSETEPERTRQRREGEGDDDAGNDVQGLSVNVGPQSLTDDESFGPVPPPPLAVDESMQRHLSSPTQSEASLGMLSEAPQARMSRRSNAAADVRAVVAASSSETEDEPAAAVESAAAPSRGEHQQEPSPASTARAQHRPQARRGASSSSSSFPSSSVPMRRARRREDLF